jgi:ABC-type sugar transport system ATPase subunit
MLYVTRDQVEAMTLGDRIVVLEGGHVKQIDTPMNLYERPKNTYVAAFFRESVDESAAGCDRRGTGVKAPELRAADNTVLDCVERRVGEAPRRVWRARGDHGCASRGHRLRFGWESAAGRRHRARATRCREPLGSEAFLSARIGSKEITARVCHRAGYRLREARWSWCSSGSGCASLTRGVEELWIA